MLSNRLYEDRTEVIPKVLHTIEEIPLGGYFILFHLMNDIYVHPDISVFYKGMDGSIKFHGTLKKVLQYYEPKPIYFCLDLNDCL